MHWCTLRTPAGSASWHESACFKVPVSWGKGVGNVTAVGCVEGVTTDKYTAAPRSATHLERISGPCTCTPHGRACAKAELASSNTLASHVVLALRANTCSQTHKNHGVIRARQPLYDAIPHQRSGRLLPRHCTRIKPSKATTGDHADAARRQTAARRQNGRLVVGDPRNR